jgi:hypothetical protein
LCWSVTLFFGVVVAALAIRAVGRPQTGTIA